MISFLIQCKVCIYELKIKNGYNNERNTDFFLSSDVVHINIVKMHRPKKGVGWEEIRNVS